MAKSVLQDWVMEIGLRHQGVLVSAVRGCDTLPGKKNPAKKLSRYFRADVLNAHCGDASQSKSFIEWYEDEAEFKDAADAMFDELDRLPFHFVSHLLHAAAIVGFYHPNPEKASCWKAFYERAVRKLHLNPETKEQLDERLNRDEENFGKGTE